MDFNNKWNWAKITLSSYFITCLVIVTFDHPLGIILFMFGIPIISISFGLWMKSDDFNKDRTSKQPIIEGVAN